jgi:hypothetical protein
MEIGDYIIINNTKLGKIVKKPFDNITVKLDNNAKFVNPILEQYKLQLMPENATNILGYDFTTKNDSLAIVDSTNLFTLVIHELSNPAFESFANLDYMFQQQYKNIANNIDKIIPNMNYQFGIEQTFPNGSSYFPKFTQNNTTTYQNEDKAEDNYEKYIQIMMERIFNDDDTDVSVITDFGDKRTFVQEAEKEHLVAYGTKKDILQPAMLEILNRFEPIDEKFKFDFDTSVLYKHITTNNADIHAIGSQMINNIKNMLLALQSDIVYENGEKILKDLNIFDFLTFKISNGYVVLESKINMTPERQRVITPVLVPNLQILANFYGESINYKQLAQFVTQNASSAENLKLNKDIINEAIHILSQEYVISFQPDVNILYWCLCRLLIAWYADPVLSDKIYKVKILINLYRSRGKKTFNKDEDVQPIISVYPYYGKRVAIEVASKLNYYFFAYKNMGFSDNKPSYFEKFDDLMSYTNGSMELKKYVRYVMAKGGGNPTMFNKNMTSFSMGNGTILYQNEGKNK